ncbi:DUF1326 domain-containing protein [Hoyosella sp. YIM 151337]|uniref:DUF1326 domain-containing protein n=1 Tax=Hoyosella sp. YIM 151337 TaxID=2992742 RepID=UPI002235B355|nr:DUF1326 domain-containing protein [Hoyosella sp. YIM 151337]MCW4353545.1 DUF1326 domain-containing protein [Hoyosella sp. YIM 151337]
MSWRIKANYYEACNCALGCPCNMSGFPTHGFCEGTVGFYVTEGERDGVDLKDAKVAAAVKWPGAIHEGNGVMALFIDATEEQQQALLPILTAEDPGLPWEILAATVSEVHGPFFESIEIDDRDTDSRVQVGDKLVIQMESFKNPVTGEKHEPHMVLKDGFIFKDGQIGTTSTLILDADGVTFDHAGNNAYYSHVEWSSENRMAPAAQP